MFQRTSKAAIQGKDDDRAAQSQEWSRHALFTGLDYLTEQIQTRISPGGPFSQAKLTSNSDGSYLLTFAASLAADFLLDVTYKGTPLASLAVEVSPGIVNAASSTVQVLQKGRLSVDG